MDFRVVCLFVAVLALAESHPTLYKLNENKVLEADLVPVSSTVIPLPIYQVSSSLNFGTKDEKVVKPVGPISLITSANKKKSYPKPKHDEVSIVKEVNEKEFNN